MIFSARGQALTKSFEALRLTAYKDQRGIWTIGWGHTGHSIVEGLVWTADQAEIAFEADTASAVAVVNHTLPLIAHSPTLTQNQFDALVDFVFNAGIGSFLNSTLHRLVLAGDMAGAAEQFAVWNKTHINGVLTVDNGLTRRRAAERDLFLSN